MSPLLANAFHLQSYQLHSKQIWADGVENKLLRSLISCMLFRKLAWLSLWEIRPLSVSSTSQVLACCFL